MLVLTRKQQEKIRIGEHITITVLRMKGKAVRLGIEAPSEVSVLRGELAFDASPEVSTETQDNGAAGESAPAGGVAVTSCGDSRKGRTDAEWSTDSNPRLAVSRVRVEEPQATVSFARVPRDKAAQIVPSLIPGTNPLRAMLDRRTASM